MSTGASVERKISHFDLHEVIGTGGMGIVYRATDILLGRPVALKFIQTSDVHADAYRKRLIEEARAASSLDHPNICTIFESGETPEGEVFIAMAFYEGRTLDVILRDGPLEMRRTLSIAIQTGRALAAAHEELLVHRDIKPSNIMLTRHDTVKVLDFGLAKIRGTAGLGEGATVDGTPAYMAPEQLTGANVDHRADIWALGVVLYQMLTGRLPFDGPSVRDVVASVLRETPPPPSAIVPSLPRALDAIVIRALSRDPRLRYERVEQLVDDLIALRSDSNGATDTLRRLAARRESSIAVLPFSDMSARQDQGFLCEGIAEEIIGALMQIPALRVTSRTSSFQFRGGGSDVREIGAKLNVETVLEGSVRRVGDRVRISAQLVNVQDGYRLWYERFDRGLSDILAVEEEIAQRIADALQLTFSESASLPTAISSSSGEAYALYLQGRQFFHQQRKKALEVAIQTFQSAIELEPQNARAHAGIADCHSFLRLYFGHGKEAVAAALEASAKALALAPDLAEAHASRGLALFLTGELDAAEAEAALAVKLNRSLYDAHYIAARISFSRGHISEAAEHFHRACSIVPEAFDSWYLLGMCYRRLGKQAKARATDLECIEAVKTRVRQHPDDTRAWTMGAAVLAELGEPERATAWVERAIGVDRDEPVVAYNAACVYVHLGRFDEALQCLGDSIRNGTISREWAENDPDLDPLRNDPRFRNMLEAVPASASGA